MKLLIDIPEHVYEHAKETTEDSRDEFDAMRAIANGTQQESRSEIPNTCGDAISRQAVDDAIYDYSRSCNVDYSQIMEYIEKIPSILPLWSKDAGGERMTREEAFNKFIKGFKEIETRPNYKIHNPYYWECYYEIEELLNECLEEVENAD